MSTIIDNIEDEELDAFQEEDLPPTQDNEMYEHYRVVVDKGQSKLRVDKFLAQRIEWATRNRIQKAADAGCILVNEVAVKSNYIIKPCDIITVVMATPPREIIIIPEEMDLDIVYEDQDLMVINKRPGLVVHPGFGNYTGTLMNGLAYHLREDPTMFDSTDPRFALVHRIDKDTSGLIVVAKNPEAKANLALQFFNKTTKRKYIAIVWGNISEDEGTIVGNIGRHLKDRLQMTVFPDAEHGKHAVTHYRVIERLGYVTMVECQLETGRTHQIRVHMKYLGHTLFNDERYGGHEILKGTTFAKYRQFVNNCFAVCPRQALHAQTLGFIHPRTKEEMHFTSEVPQDMLDLAERWRKYISNRDITQE